MISGERDFKKKFGISTTHMNLLDLSGKVIKRNRKSTISEQLPIKVATVLKDVKRAL